MEEDRMERGEVVYYGLSTPLYKHNGLHNVKIKVTNKKKFSI